MPADTHGRYRLGMPDVGDVLNDPSLSDISDIIAIGGYVGMLDEEEENDVIRNRLLYFINTRGGHPFKSLSPPPTHLCAVFSGDGDERVDEESLHHWLTSSQPPSLIISSHERPNAYMCTLLANLPSHCHLLCYTRTITEEIVDALLASQCHVDLLNISQDYLLTPQAVEKLGGIRCRALEIDVSHSSLKSGGAAFSCISDWMSFPDCKLVELTMVQRSPDYGSESDDDSEEEDADDDSEAEDADDGSNAYDDDFEDHYMMGVSRALGKPEGCKLRRLDIRGLPPLGPKNMLLLVGCIASPSCPIHDLGINLSSSHLLNKAQHTSGLSTLAQAFQSESSHDLSKLKALRFTINSNEGAACVMEILGSPPSYCKVRLLRIWFDEYDADEPFFKKLKKSLTGGLRNIECLRVYFDCKADDERGVSEMSSLPDFLSWKHCSLLWLQCFFDRSPTTSSIEESLQTKIANSLEANLLLNYLGINGFNSPAALARAAAFLARNRLYKSTGLSKEESMKPQVARLFLCGHAEVGKTTLCKALRKLHDPHTDSFDKLFRSCRRGVEPRTRGLEIHQLHFKEDQKLAIFDLAGQPDYHIFHHYFMNNTSHDLFTIVGKYDSSFTLASQLTAQLEYWMKFVVSHRSTVRGPNPRVILVINFFHAPQSQLIQHRAEDLTVELRNKYRQHLQFCGVFGIVALNKKAVVPVLTDLERLLLDCLRNKSLIPRLCQDLLVKTLPQLVNSRRQFSCGIYTCTKAPASKLFVDFSQVKMWYIQQGNQQQLADAESQASDMLERRIHAGLVELHNSGDVIFFPPVAASQEHRVAEVHIIGTTPKDGHPSNFQHPTNDASPIITDPNWFCTKVIGNLLAPEVLSGKFEWTDMDVRQVLMDNGCPKQLVAEVMRYLHSLEFCFPFNDNASQPKKYIFPAVARNRELQWPRVFIGEKATGTDGSVMQFYGRRIKCKDTERHLIPSAVFARLQVRLNEFCGASDKRSYKLGYHWVSFVTGCIGVMVRFGRLATSSNRQDSNQYSNTTQLSSCMMEDDYPEWIDILLGFASSQDAERHQATPSAEYSVMNRIRRLIFDICQATSRGIPTVALEECVLQYEAQEHVMPLAVIQSCIREEGLKARVAWEDQQDIAAVDLLFPEELQEHIMKHIQAVKEIREEFAATNGEDKGKLEKKEAGDVDQQLYEQLPAENKVLYHLLSSKLNKGFEVIGAKVDMVGAKMDDIMALAKLIKMDVGKVMAHLQKAEKTIVANCSTRLLTQVLLQGVLPAYPYLTNSEGKMEKLKTYLVVKTATIHFLCESAEEGPHEVKGQAGKRVAVEKGILMKVAPFLVPTLTILCCAARFAANTFLPGVAPLIFSPFLEFLKSIGLTEQDLQSQILPKAANALFDGVDVKIEELYGPKSRMQHVDEQQRKEGTEAIQEFLGSGIDNVDMEKDFGLYLVQVAGRHTNPSVRARWLCEHHAKGHTKLKRPENPFSHIAK